MTRSRQVTISVLSLCLSACATTVKVPEIPLLDEPLSPVQRVPEPLPPVKIVEVPTAVAVPGQLKPLAKRAKSPKDLATKDQPAPAQTITGANAAARLEPVTDGFINAMQVYPFIKGALFQVYTAVNQVTDIALEPNEKLTSVSAGDTVRWVVGDTTSGEVGGQTGGPQVHILIKPSAANLATNLVITTDKRTYHLELHATDTAYMASVSWTYPLSDLIALRARNAEAVATSSLVVDQGLNLEAIRFRYRLEGDAPWKPTQVFDDGAKVYIRFPAGLAQSDAPPLFVLGTDGKPALINYRVRGTTYVVDRLFAAAELRLGSAPQRVVRIVRTDAVERSREAPR